MKIPLAIALLLSCAACSREQAPAEDVAEAAGQLVEPAASQSPLARGKWPPQDTCAKVEGADQFRTRLAAAVKARDIDGVVALAADDVKLDFGDGAGSAELRSRLADTSLGLWDEIDALMGLGCSANEQGGITIPWFFDQDFGAADPYFAMLVTGEAVPLLERPDPAAKALATVSWDLVEIASLNPESAYQRVELADGKVGFIATGKLRSLIDYRLTASSRNGRWRIISFVAGD
ncbi:MAG TPA: hypothetical protein VI168_18150 [Croceibacterium sp.]